MKKSLVVLAFAAACVLGTLALTSTHAASDAPPSSIEYATIRWGGPESTQIIRPDGKVEFLASRLARTKPPPGADARSFYMNVVMNDVVREGYEFAGLTDDQIIMKRPVRR